MAALVVVDVSRGSDPGRRRARLEIFPGSATPTVFAAGTPFWIGYGFTPDSEAAGEPGPVDEETRFELDVDGHPVALEVDILRDGDFVARKTEFVDFEAGLPAGWHSFSGRWYDEGRLLLSNRVSIDFVER